LSMFVAHKVPDAVDNSVVILSGVKNLSQAD
jgi:hypothetical protein